MKLQNPLGTDGFDFLEFATPSPDTLFSQFQALGLHPISRHKTADVTILQEQSIRFLVNQTPGSQATQFANLHGPAVTAMGFRVLDAQFAFQQALAHGAQPYEGINETKVYEIPAIYGVGGTLIYFVDYQEGQANYQKHFTSFSSLGTPNGIGLTYIDHVTHNLYRGDMQEWADFYSRIFNFREIRYFDIEGKLTGLKSRALMSPCGKIRIPLNESADDQSQIEEFLATFKGEGIQHIALGTDNIYKSVEQLRQHGIRFLDTPDSYYELIEKRLPKHGEPLAALQKQRILIDGDMKKDKKLLLQIFTTNMLGPAFFEVIQRKGDEGFGEGNFRALFESIELDQIRRGILTEESK